MIRKYRKSFALCLKASALLVSLSSGYGRAFAGSCTGSGGVFLCSGSAAGTDVLQDLTGSPLAVTTSSGFGISTSGDAFNLRSFGGGLTFTDNYMSTITGSEDGIVAINDGNLNLSITTTGDVTGNNYNGVGIGIWADNRATGNDLNITSSAVNGGDDGINSKNSGMGHLWITSSGEVKGDSDKGILAHNYGTDLTITATKVTGGLHGIVATNDGNSELSIITTGEVSGGTYGIGIWGHNSGTDLTISTAEVTGGDKGILARNDGTGRLLITTSGEVTSTGDGALAFGIAAYNQGAGALSITAGDAVSSTGAGTYAIGIYATNSSNGTDLTISATDVTGGYAGIYTNNHGQGTLSITSSNMVKGTRGIGIMAHNHSNGNDLTISTTDVIGSTEGIVATNSGSGNLSITTAGTIQGKNLVGIRADNNGGGSLSITTNPGTNVSGGYVGIWADNSSQGTDLTISTGNVTGDLAAILGRNFGSGGLSITTSGTVTGQYYGIYAGNFGGQTTVINVLGQLVTNPGYAAITSVGAPATVNFFAGSTTTGDIFLTDGNNKINLAGNLTGSVLMGNGNDAFIQVGGSTLTGTVDGGNGIDTLGFDNMGTVNNSVIGATYLNFENLGIYGGSTTLTGVWDFSGGSTTISGGNLLLNGNLRTHAFVINHGGYANIAGTLNSSSVTVGGGMDAGGTVNTGAFMINNGGYANISGILSSSSVTVDGRMNVGGTVNNTGAFMINTGGYVNVAGLLNSNSVTVNGAMDIGGTLDTDAFTVGRGGSTRITGNLNSETATVYGGMNLNGTVTADNLTIASGGLLSGSGRVNGSLVNYGTISPGNSIGTLRVNGSARFMPGSIYQAEIRADGSSDRIDVNGPVSLDGGTVKTALSRSLYTNGQNWKLISATGGVNGRFAGLSYRLDSETVDLELAYTSKEVMLEIVRTPFSSFGLTPAGKAVGAGLDEVVPIAGGNMAGFITSMDFDMSRPQIGKVLNALSPELYTSFSAVGLQGASVFANATTQHQAESRHGKAFGLTSLTDENTGTEGEWTLWSRALGNWSERDSDVGAMGYNQELGGLVAGADRQFTEVLRAGILMGYTDSDLEWDGTEHSGGMGGRHIGLYASAEPGNFFIDASGSYSDFSADANRIIIFDGLTAEAESSFDADVWSGMLAGGYNFRFNNWLLSPGASLNYARLSQDGFSEYGADFLNLDIAGTDMESLTSSLGIRFSGLLANGQWQFMPRLDLRWLHQFENEGAAVTANFTNYESATFDVTGIASESDQGIFSLGLTAEYSRNLSLFVDYGVAAADGYSSQLFSGGLSWSF